MNISELFTSVQMLMRELTFGPAPTGAFVLNPGDAGLLASLDRLSADEAFVVPRALTPVELNGVVGSVVHLAYHVGAIRQIHAGARGPKDGQR